MSILFNNPLLGASGQGPSADLGDTIDQSLRFTSSGSSQKLQSNSSLATDHTAATLSYWLKFSNVNSTALLGLINCNGGILVVNSFDGRTTRPRFFNGGGHSTSVYSDPSAWYHVVCIYGRKSAPVNTVSHETFINGELILDNTINSVAAQSDNFRIGEVPGHGTGFQGYIAEFNYLDGTAIGLTADGNPDEFGRYNEDGVWVPKNYTGSYGTNGFHLTFDSSQTNGIGHDSSGNGNHFTATGFDTADVALWSSQVFTTGYSTQDFTSTRQNFNSTQPPTRSFDGNSNTAGQSAGGDDDSTYFVRFTTPIQNVTSIEMKPTNGSGFQYHYINGTQGTFSSGGVKQTIYSGTAITLETVGVNWISSNAGSGFYQLWVNGTELIDNTDNDVDYLDTPTSNYATLNPLNYALATMSNANLAFRSSGSGAWQFRPASVGGQSTGKWYWEARAVGSGSSLMASIINDQYEKVNTSDVYPGQGAGVGTGGWSLYGANGRLYRNGVDQVASEGLAYSTDDILMFALDLENGAWWAGQNGTWYQSATTSQIEAGTTTNAIDTGTLSGEFWPGFVTQGSTANGWDVNFGQMPFVYTQPSGFNAWQTNNLAEPTIKNGKEYFDVVTWSGDGTNGRDITGLEFQPDLVWIKCRNRALNHNLYDSVRGVTKHLTPNENYADQTTANSLTAFNSDGFQVGINASDNTLSPASDYVAWCWNAGGTSTNIAANSITASTPSIASTVRANTDAGFSIVSFTGNTTPNSSVGHGLTQAPEFVITKKRENAGNWNTFHASIGSTSYIVLNLTDRSFTDSNMYNGTTSTVVNIGSYDAINANGEEMIMYCWHSVEGFSKFGSYTGNGSSDGPFIYTGFRPAFILIKNVDISNKWIIADTTRNPSNGTSLQLFPNETTAENSASNNFDILSNGFKLRTSDSATNGAQTLLYAAFAENPFGGENAPPATAR